MNWVALNLYLNAMTADELRTVIRELMTLALTGGSVADSIQTHAKTRPATALVFLLQSPARQCRSKGRH
jgi:hypothetical protein